MAQIRRGGRTTRVPDSAALGPRPVTDPMFWVPEKRTVELARVGGRSLCSRAPSLGLLLFGPTATPRSPIRGKQWSFTQRLLVEGLRRSKRAR
jgi:hypothetical protein